MEPLHSLSPSCRSISPLAPRSISVSGCKKNSVLADSRSDQENTPPINPNVQIQGASSALDHEKTSNQRLAHTAAENPSLNGPKDGSVPLSNQSVKVVVRIRPQQEKGSPRIVQRIAYDTLSIGDRKYSFDSILDSGSSQDDVFKLIGVPLVKSSLAGFNNSIVSYGQSGTGKTYTMWGPPSAMVDSTCTNHSQGIVPRIFQMLFSEICKHSEESSDDTWTKYQCRCSFFEIYNEQIIDLLDQSKSNFLRSNEARNAFQIENLSEEYVNTMEDVTQLLVKGLSNRKVGATCVNSKSSRSHVIFTCIIEYWCKGVSSNVFSSSKTSKLTFSDLAGTGNCNVDGFLRQTLQEHRFIKNSISKLGRLVNILSGFAHQEDGANVPYGDCCLTNVLQDTLGGNTKATFICTIFPDERYKARTLSTIRFGEIAKQMKNVAVINEISEDAVNDLSAQIRQLKEELVRAKSCGSSCAVNTDGCFKRHNARESLNALRWSLNRSLILPSMDIDNHPEVEMDVDVEQHLKELCVQLNNLNFPMEEQEVQTLKTEDPISNLSSDPELELSVNKNCSSINALNTDIFSFPMDNELDKEFSKVQVLGSPNSLKGMLMENKQSPGLEEPQACASPKDDFLKRATLKKIDLESPKLGKVEPIRSSMQSSKINPIESLAASLQRGLEIIDYHQRNSGAAHKSPVALSLEHLSSISYPSGRKKVDSCGQISPKLVNAPVLCSACNQPAVIANIKKQNNQAAPPEELNNVSESGIKVLEDVSLRNIELEALCTEQAMIIKKLYSQIDMPQNSKSEQNPSVAIESKNDENANRENAVAVAEFCGSEADDSLLEQIRNGSSPHFEKEKERWIESESRWISLAEELRIDLESNRRVTEIKELELMHEKQCTAELDDALRRSIWGHARMIEHYAELQEKHEELLAKHRKVMEAIAEVKEAAARAGTKHRGSAAFAAALEDQLSFSRIERERERACLRDQNRILKLQLRDTAEAVQAAGELLVRLKEAEEVLSITEEKYGQAQQEVEKLRRQLEKLKKKHSNEIATMKHYLAESRLPESALEPLYHQQQQQQHDFDGGTRSLSEDMSWKSAFKPFFYQPAEKDYSHKGISDL